MPFLYGRMWIMPLLMPLIVGGVVYFLYKNGVFNGMCDFMKNKNHQFNDQIDNSSNGSRKDLTPVEILKRRYAGGEISTEEYKKMKNELKNN